MSSKLISLIHHVWSFSFFSEWRKHKRVHALDADPVVYYNNARALPYIVDCEQGKPRVAPEIGNNGYVTIASIAANLGGVGANADGTDRYAYVLANHDGDGGNCEEKAKPDEYQPMSKMAWEH